MEKITIVGSGPAGLTAAIYAARASLSPLIIEGEQPGGQLTITSDVENFPGFSKGIMGPELMREFRAQAERFGTRFIQARITQAKLGSPSTLTLSNGQSVQTQALIIATGASSKWLGLDSEKRLLGKGVSSCATCDGFFFRNLEVAVVGGGDSAMEEATFLTKFAKKVTLIHRRDSFRASKIMVEKAKNNPKIDIRLDSAIEEILGDNEVQGIRLKNLKTGKTENIPLQGVFVAIGHEPNTGVFRSQLKTDATGYLIVEPGTTRTSVSGVFAAGDVADHVYRQAITAAGTGCMAALDAERWLEHGNHGGSHVG